MDQDRLRLPPRPRVMLLGRFKDWRRQHITDTVALLEGTLVLRGKDVQVAVVGDRASQAKLDALRKANAELIELSDQELLDVDLEAEFIAALRTGDVSSFSRREQQARAHDLSGLTISIDRHFVDVSRSTLHRATIEDPGTKTNQHRSNGRIEARDASFDGARFVGDVRGHFVGGSWRGADFGQARFTHCSFTDVDLGQAKLEDTEWSDDASFVRCRFDGQAPEKPLRGSFVDCSFVGFAGTIHSAELRGCDLRDAKLGESLLAGADLASCTLDGADLDRAQLFGCTPLPEPLTVDAERIRAMDGSLRLLTKELKISVWVLALVDTMRIDLYLGEEHRMLKLPIAQGLALLRASEAWPEWDTLSAEDAGARDAWSQVLGDEATPAKAKAAPVDDSELVAQLAEDPTDDARWAVLCDHLLEQGDPRGPKLRRLLDDDPMSRRSHHSELEVPEQLAVEYLGGPDAQSPSLRLRWWRLFVRDVEVCATKIRRKDLEELLAQPAFRLVQSVRINARVKSGMPLVEALRPRLLSFVYGVDWEAVIYKMKTPVPELRELRITSSFSTKRDAPLFARLFPNLARLELPHPSSEIQTALEAAGLPTTLGKIEVDDIFAPVPTAP